MAAGWALALFAATSALPAFAALFRTAPRGAADPAGPAQPEQARREQARLVRQRALSHRGMLPHLRRRIHEDPSSASSAADGSRGFGLSGLPAPPGQRSESAESSRLTTHRAQMMKPEKAIITMDQTG